MRENWTQITKPEFQQEMLSVGKTIRDLVYRTSGPEEGLNVVLTIIATYACSMGDKGWSSMMDSVMSGVINGDTTEAKMEQATQLVFSALNKLRNVATDCKSKYVSQFDPVEKPEGTGFTEFPGRGGLA